MRELASRFSRGEVLFDVVSPVLCKDHFQNPAVKALGSKFVWVAGELTDIEAWAANLHYVDTAYYMNQHRLRWGVLGNLIALIPAIGKSARMLHFHFS